MVDHAGTRFVGRLKQNRAMLLPFSGFLCLWLCGQAAAARLRWQQTKATFSPHHESAAAGRSAQSRGWRTVVGEDNGATGGASAQMPRRAASDAQNGARRIRDGSLRADQSVEPLVRACSLGWSGRNRRRRRSPEPGRTKRSEPLLDGAASEALPAAMAQGQEAGLNASDYEEEDSVPDFADPTPLVPVDTRTRRKQVKNPFYPLTAESFGAYAVTIAAAVIFSVGIIGNVSVMCIVCHNYYMRSVSNSLLANLALWDFVVLFFCLPLVLFHALTKNWLLGDFSCRIVPYLEVSPGPGVSVTWMISHHPAPKVKG